MRISNAAVLVLVSSATAIVGLGAGYKIAEHRLGVKFEERLAEETASMKKFYKTVPGQKYATPEEAVEALIEPYAAGEALKPDLEVAAGRKEQKVPYHKIVRSEAVVAAENAQAELPEARNNVFVKDENKGDVYRLTPEEFEENEPDYIQSTLTWYAKDNILADEQDEKIEDIENTVGILMVSDFTNEDDPNTIHARNLILQLDFEILKSDGSYVEEVLGEIYEPPIVRPSERIRRGE